MQKFLIQIEGLSTQLKLLINMEQTAAVKEEISEIIEIIEINLYLMTNSKTSQCGIYELPKQIIVTAREIIVIITTLELKINL